MHVAAPPRRKMTADEFIAWAMEQPETEHYELADGEIVPMAPERVLHNQVKFHIALRLRAAIKQAGLACEVYPDGMAIEVDPATVYEPDALVRCGKRLADEEVKVTDPVIVVEVASPSTSRVDAVTKFSGYFRVPSLHHYLLADAKRRLIVHHRRAADGIATRIVTDGRLHLDPPGIEVTDLFPPPEEAS